MKLVKVRRGSRSYFIVDAEESKDSEQELSDWMAELNKSIEIDVMNAFETTRANPDGEMAERFARFFKLLS